MEETKKKMSKLKNVINSNRGGFCPEKKRMFIIFILALHALFLISNNSHHLSLLHSSILLFDSTTNNNGTMMILHNNVSIQYNNQSLKNGNMLILTKVLLSSSDQQINSDDNDEDNVNSELTRIIIQKKVKLSRKERKKYIPKVDQSNQRKKKLTPSGIQKVNSKTTTITNQKQPLPNFVFHVGPPKTASSTIQDYLTTWHNKKILKKLDKYVFVGRFLIWDRRNTTDVYDTITNLDCHYQMYEVRTEYEKKAENNDDDLNGMTLGETILSKLSCARDIIQNIKHYSNNMTNLVLSEEALSLYHMKHYGDDYVRYRQFYGPDSYPTIFDWISLHSILQNYYKITVIVTYRRYSEWLPSAKYQIDAYHKTKPLVRAWPKYNDVEGSIDVLSNKIIGLPTANTTTNVVERMKVKRIRVLKLTIRENSELQTNGRFIEPMFPTWWKQNLPPGTDNFPPHYMDNVIRGIDQVNSIYRHRHNTSSTSRIIRIVLMNMHATSPPTKGSQMNDKSTTKISLPSSLYTKPASVRSLFMCSLPYGANLCRYSQEVDQVEGDEIYKNTGGTNIYDELVVNAAKYGFINITKYDRSRHIIAKMAEAFHKALLRKYQMKKNMTSSLVIPNNNKDSNRTDDDNDKDEDNNDDNGIDNFEFPLICPSNNELNEFLNQSLIYEETLLSEFHNSNKENHISNFWKNVKKDKYCSINTIIILRKSYWQRFFLKTVPKKLYKKVMKELKAAVTKKKSETNPLLDDYVEGE